MAETYDELIADLQRQHRVSRLSIGQSVASNAIEAIKALQAENDRLRKTVDRLGSSESMTTPFMRRDNREGLELLARIDFARAALEPQEAGG